MDKNKDFQWTDKLAAEFAEFYRKEQGGGCYWGQDLLEVFKKQKEQPLFTASDGIKIYEGQEYWFTNLLQERELFHNYASVAGNSGKDQVTYIYFGKEENAKAYIRNRNKPPQPNKIIEFRCLTPNDNSFKFFFQTTQPIPESKYPSIKEAIERELNLYNEPGLRTPDKKVLFTTEDGVGKYYNDKVWLLSQNTWISTEVSLHGKPFTGVSNEFKYFSTKEAAEKYIIENKPCLSWDDLKKITWWRKEGAEEFTYFQPDALKNLVEQKLKTNL